MAMNSKKSAILLLVAILNPSVDAYLPSSSTSTGAFRRRLSGGFVLASSSTTTTTSADFSTFANSLESDLDDDFDDNASNDPMRGSAATADKPWQAKLDDLLDPSTNLADRQILLSELLTSNDKIRDDVLDALTNRKVR